MNRVSKIITTLAAGAMALTSCSLFGTEITQDEAITQLTNMQKAMEDKYGEIDIEENLPVDLQYLYVESKGFNNIDGEKVNATNTMFFSLEENNIYMTTINETKSKDKTEKEESYAVQADDKFYTWDVSNGITGEVKDNGLAALGLVLVYAMMLAMATPEYGITALETEGTEGISFKKYSESSLDIKYSVPHERDLDAVYTKEVYTISYKDNMGTKVVIEGIDEDGTKNMETTMNFTFGNKKVAKPTIPAQAA